MGLRAILKEKFAERVSFYEFELSVEEISLLRLINEAKTSLKYSKHEFSFTF